jgi:hypothetical protein
MQKPHGFYGKQPFFDSQESINGKSGGRERIREKSRGFLRLLAFNS